VIQGERCGTAWSQKRKKKFGGRGGKKEAFNSTGQRRIFSENTKIRSKVLSMREESRAQRRSGQPQRKNRGNEREKKKRPP